MLARDGRERAIVNRDDHYSPHFQVGTPAPPCLTFSLPTATETPPSRGSLSWARPRRLAGVQWPALPPGFTLREGSGGCWPVADADLGDPGGPVVASVLFQSLRQKPNSARPGSPKGLGRTYTPEGQGVAGVGPAEVPLPSAPCSPLQEIRMLKKIVSVHPVSARPGPRRPGGPETQTAPGVGGMQRSLRVHTAGAGLSHGEAPELRGVGTDGTRGQPTPKPESRRGS